MKLPALLTGLLVLASLASAADRPISIDLDVREHTLSNGMKVLLVPRKGSPRVACRLVYKVGSVNERPGITGISHLLEHMMFKGTDRVGVTDPARDRALIEEIDLAHAEWTAAKAAGNAGAASAARARFDAKVGEEKGLIKKDELWAAYQAAGATGLNAFTNQDFTVYIVTLPKNRVELFFWLEADRMRNAVMREFHSEREVVKEERRLRTVNTPTGMFGESLNALAFKAHPYRLPVVGWMSDLDGITREGLATYHRTYYTPRNSVLVLAGDLDADRCLELAERYFGSMPSGPAPPPVVTVEPPQRGRKLFSTSGGAPNQVRVLYHTPRFDHPDGAALEVLAAILSGDSGRFEERLVRQLSLARNARASASRQNYPDVFSLSAVAAGDTAPEALLEALEMEVKRVRTEKVSEAELDRVKNQTLANQLRSMKRVGWLAVRLGMSEARGTWRDAIEHPKRVQAVTADDVRRVARKYLTEENSTVGLFRREKEVGE